MRKKQVDYAWDERERDEDVILIEERVERQQGEVRSG